MWRRTVRCVPWIMINNIIEGEDENKIILDHQQHCETPSLLYLKTVPWGSRHKSAYMPVSRAGRFTEREAHRVSWNDSLLYCRQRSHKTFAREAVESSFFFPAPHFLIGQIASRCCLPICVCGGKSMNQKQSCVEIFKIPRTVDSLQLCRGCKLISMGGREFLSWVIAVPDSILLLLLPLCWTYLTEVNIACWF